MIDLRKVQWLMTGLRIFWMKSCDSLSLSLSLFIYIYIYIYMLTNIKPLNFLNEDLLGKWIWAYRERESNFLNKGPLGKWIWEPGKKESKFAMNQANELVLQRNVAGYSRWLRSASQSLFEILMRARAQTNNLQTPKSIDWLEDGMMINAEPLNFLNEDLLGKWIPRFVKKQNSLWREVTGKQCGGWSSWNVISCHAQAVGRN